MLLLYYMAAGAAVCAAASMAQRRSGAAQWRVVHQVFQEADPGRVELVVTWIHLESFLKTVKSLGRVGW